MIKDDPRIPAFVIYFHSKAWKTHTAIDVEDCLLTCDQTGVTFRGYGARYLFPFSEGFPHFEVSNSLNYVGRIDDKGLTVGRLNRK